MKLRSNTAAITTAMVGMGMAATAAYMMSGSGKSKKRSKMIKKTTGAALRQVGDFIDNVSYMMR